MIRPGGGRRPSLPFGSGSATFPAFRSASHSALASWRAVLRSNARWPVASAAAALVLLLVLTLRGGGGRQQAAAVADQLGSVRASRGVTPSEDEPHCRMFRPRVKRAPWTFNIAIVGAQMLCTDTCSR